MPATIDRHAGFTLLELLIVIAMLAVISAAVIPSAAPGDEAKVEAAAREVAAAIEFARAEAIRTGAVHGVEVSQTTQKVTVYEADLASNPLGKAALLYHPVDRKVFQFDLDDPSEMSGAAIVNTLSPFLYTGYSRLKNLVFDAAGTPIWIATGTSTTYQLDDGTVEIASGVHQRTVTVSPVTGRVTVQ